MEFAYSILSATRVHNFVEMVILPLDTVSVCITQCPLLDGAMLLPAHPFSPKMV